MSGLFAPLVAAAQGTAPAAEPQPRARFDDGFGSVPNIEWRDADPVREPEARSATTSLPRGKAFERHAPVAPSSETSARTPEVRPASPAPMLPPRAPAPLAEHAVTVPSADAGVPLPSREDPARPVAREVERASPAAHEAIAPAPAAAIAPDTTIAPLLPAVPEPSLWGPAPENPLRSSPGETEDAVSGPLLKIGRIEVRPPAPASAAASAVKTAAITTRAVMVPRAQVRQSLDEYRASRRR
jgi:hypothetical protein